MGAPISGDDGDQNTISDHLDETATEEGDSELEERISDSAMQIIETVGSSEIPEATPSEGMNSDLMTNRVEYEAREGVLVTILARIRQAVSQIWKNIFPRHHRSETSSSLEAIPRMLLKETELPAVTSEPPYFHTLQTTLATCRSFFFHVFLRLSAFLRREHPSMPLDLCGANSLSLEAAVAFALILRLACKWVAEDALEEGLPLESLQEVAIYNALSLDGISNVETVSQEIAELLYSNERVDGLANLRGLTKIVCSPYLGTGQYFHVVNNLDTYDKERNYNQVLACAVKIDEFMDRSSNEALIMHDILYLLRQDRSKELGDFLMMWAEAYDIQVNYDVVNAILETNLPILEEDYRSHPDAYQNKLNYVICEFFCNDRLTLIEPRE
ncbi:hypothetical protein [Candidatus Chlamydia sanziniae]|uniref:Uncharacterized protein n=1 Tax=Candidatus Chlamydia sanziniae TaxID=1806891 RepID=A0A1A9HU12_9CHLA|nr:hypothetical protein [Candidatus Chlamydia sanziniae]ANH78479.1 hypothetical protein Cs308_0308 [Candidatus Chlamydia sanziniae]